MKKIAVFGGTGMTGLCTVEAALKQGESAAREAGFRVFFVFSFFFLLTTPRFLASDRVGGVSSTRSPKTR